MKRLFLLTTICLTLISCGDSYSLYIMSIDNKSNYDIVLNINDVYDSDEIITILCLANKETIIDEGWGESVKQISCQTPYVFRGNMAEIIIDNGNKQLIKDISADNNWDCEGEKDKGYYSKIKSTFVIYESDIQ